MKSPSIHTRVAADVWEMMREVALRYGLEGDDRRTALEMCGRIVYRQLMGHGTIPLPSVPLAATDTSATPDPDPAEPIEEESIDAAAALDAMFDSLAS